MTQFVTRFGSLNNFEKGHIEMALLQYSKCQSKSPMGGGRLPA